MSATIPRERTAYALATQFTEQLLEVLLGRRPVHQIRDRVASQVAGMLAAMPRWKNPSYRLRSVHACQTTPSTVEACAVVGSADRARALVLRLEQEDARWSCTMLSVL